ncbi:MAG: glutamate--tRNA ligase family protein, partial [Myxococcota bacterium]
IEDIDQTRCKPEAENEILRDLRWLGLDWDAGPDRAAHQGPFRQSERTPLYRSALASLTTMGRVYPCTCSRKEIALAASAPHGPADEGPRYPETCRNVARPKPGRHPAMRLQTRETDVIEHRDRRLGDLGQNVHAVVGDFVIRRSDEHWAYQLAVSVDDALQDVTDVVRGDDLAGSTARQLLLRRILYPERPPLRTLHVPLMTDESGRRLAKRTGGHTIAGLRAEGATPAKIIGQLAASVGLNPGGHPKEPTDLLTAWENTDFGASLGHQV